MLSVSLLVLLASLSLMVWGRIALRWSAGRPALEPLPRNPSPWLPIASAAAAAFVALMVVLSVLIELGLLVQGTTTTLRDLQSSVVDGTMHIAIALLLLTGAGRVPLREVGLHLDPLGRQFLDGVVGFLASIIPVALMLALTYSLRTPDNQHPFLKLLQADGTPETAAWLLLTAVVVAPIKEELIFRVMLQDGLARRIGSAPAIAITSVLFCLVHGFPDSLALFPLALILGYVYDRRQSILSVVLIHALFNLTNITILLLDPEAPM